MHSVNKFVSKWCGELTEIHIFLSFFKDFQTHLFSSEIFLGSPTHSPVIVKQFSCLLSKSSWSTIVLKIRESVGWKHGVGMGLCNLTSFLSKSVNIYKWPYQTARVHSVTWKQSEQDCPSASCQSHGPRGRDFFFLNRTPSTDPKPPTESGPQQVFLIPCNQFYKICILKLDF